MRDTNDCGVRCVGAQRWKLGMIASPEKPDAVSVKVGLGRVSMRTVVLGAHVIAIENIATIRIVRGQRAWWLFALGVVVIAAAATQLNSYGAIAIAGIGFGLALIAAELFQRVESGLSIGTSDGRSTLIVSRDQVFLRRLLQLFIDRIEKGDMHPLATFDIATGRITTTGSAVAIGEGIEILGEPARTTQRQAELERADPPAGPPPPANEDESDDGLFGDTEPPRDETETGAATSDPAPPADPTGLPKPSLVVRGAAAPERRAQFDPLLDGDGKVLANDDDWLGPSQKLPGPPIGSDGATGRVLLALLVIVLLGSGVFAAWYFTGQTGPASIFPAGAAAAEAPASEIADAPR